MELDLQELIKQREIGFSELHPDPNQAQSALLLLSDAQGIEKVVPFSQYSIGVEFDIRQITLRIIEESLIELGFHLDNSLMSKLRRALFYYTEETQLENLGYSHPDSKSTTEIFINRYSQLQHGCRDERPVYYHHYN